MNNFLFSISLKTISEIKPQHIQIPTLFLKIFFNSYVLNRFHYKKYLYILSVFINRNSVILRF
ncbi:TPA: hypothetical protein I2T37_14575 [Staphylococcus aureus]|nr:hypothetical protein [Staphylococcus aureus]HAR7086485.1 hypothetical protein [Staphylococcus aureus]